MKIEVFKSLLGDWVWSCPICDVCCSHVAATFNDAMDEVDSHLSLHATAGKQLSWQPVE